MGTRLLCNDMQAQARTSARPRQRPSLPPPRGSRAGRALVRAGALVVAAAVLYVSACAVEVFRPHDDTRPADAIVVLGAAQWDGEPSPVFQARLDHALALFEQGRAPWIAVTGGSQPGEDHTEASTAANYLTANGVPAEAILPWETSARNTHDSLVAVQRIMAGQGLARALLVSDPSHSARLLDIAERLDLDAGVSPRRRPGEAPARPELGDGLRETAGVALGRVLGYRRVSWLEQRVQSRLGD
jgi:uncharacterized SAM-binding protein YcdF (DUF218 family)